MKATLQKGNLHSLRDKSGEVIYLSDFPPARRINHFDKNMRLVNGRVMKESMLWCESKNYSLQQSGHNVEANENSPVGVAEPVEKMAKQEKKGVHHSKSNEGDDGMQ